MHRAVRWVAYALLAWLVVNILAYPFSYLIPKGGTVLQNFSIVLYIELIIMILFSDVLYIKHVRRLKNTPPATLNVVNQGLIGTIVEFDYPFFITDLFLMIQIAIIFKTAF
jgi:hypothetical protein